MNIFTKGAVTLAAGFALAGCDAGRDDTVATADKPAATAGSTASSSSTASPSGTASSRDSGSTSPGAAGKPGMADSTTKPTDSSSTTVGEKMDDTVITSKVKTALMADPDIKGMNINVTTTKGEVKLEGKVASEEQVKKAMEIAREVEGVTGVQNNLQVKAS